MVRKKKKREIRKFNYERMARTAPQHASIAPASVSGGEESGGGPLPVTSGT